MKSVKLTLTKHGIAACEKMFKPGIQKIDLPGLGKMKVVTLLTHEDDSINVLLVEETLKPVAVKNSLKQCHIWGVELGLEVLPDSKPGETIFDLIVRTLLMLDTEYIPCNFILMRSHFSNEGLVEQRNDVYYNYHIDIKDMEKIATAVKNSRIAD